MYPSTLTTFTNPAATNKLNAPSHASIESNQNDALTQIETIIGREGGGDASALGTIIGDLRNPTSGGGGHVQTAVLGGTGQTTFTKGDILVAQSASVITKLAVGLDGQALTVDSSVAAGVEWGVAAGTRIANEASVISMGDTTTETSFISIVIPGSTLGTTGAIRATMPITYWSASGVEPTVIRANYGGTVASIVLQGPFTAASSSVIGDITYTLKANNSLSVQRGQLSANLYRRKSDMSAATTASVIAAISFEVGNSSVESTGDATFGITMKNAASDSQSRIDVDGFIVEKIV